MNKPFPVALFALIILCGCGDPFVPSADFSNANDGSGSGGTTLIVPGSTRTVAEMPAGWQDKNADKDQYGMRIVSISGSVEPNPQEITTQATLGMWDDSKFHTEGFGVTFNGGFANAGFNEVTLMYFDMPLDGEFRYTARIRVKRAGGISTSKGLHFGVYTPADGRGMVPADDSITGELPNWGYGQGTKGLGLFLRNEAMVQYRMYYSCANNSTTAGLTSVGNPAGLRINREYIYEIARVRINNAVPYGDSLGPYQDAGGNDVVDNNGNPILRLNAQYTFKILDSKTGEDVTTSAILPLELNAYLHPHGTPISMNPALRETVYAGITLAGSAMEISQIKIWTPESDGGNGMNWDYTVNLDADGNAIGMGSTPIFETPWSMPAYVPANRISNIAILPIGNAPAGNVSVPISGAEPVVTYSGGSGTTQWGGIVTRGHTIQITPTLEPTHHDTNIGFEFHMLHGHDIFAGIDGDDTPGFIIQVGENANHRRGIITLNPDAPAWAALNPGETVSGRFRVIGRNLNLDIPPFIHSPDYALLQTLPEFFFTVVLTKP